MSVINHNHLRRFLACLSLKSFSNAGVATNKTDCVGEPAWQEVRQVQILSVMAMYILRKRRATTDDAVANSLRLSQTVTNSLQLTMTNKLTTNDL